MVYGAGIMAKSNFVIHVEGWFACAMEGMVFIINASPVVVLKVFE